MARLKERVATYPAALKREVIADWLRHGGVWWSVFRKCAARGDVYNVSGSVNRVAAGMTQALFALNETYFVNDKGALERIGGFPAKPERYGERMVEILGHPGTTREELEETVKRLEELHGEVVALCQGRG